MQIPGIATHLRDRRQAILDAWSKAAESDPKLTTPLSLSRTQFFDHIPGMLDALDRRLAAVDLRDKLDATQDEVTNAEGHGLQRWQQGYNEQEVMREWVWLNACLAEELASYARMHAGLDPEMMSRAWRLVSDFLVTGMSESVAQYSRLQRGEAAARLRVLEDALRQLEALEKQRADAWREAAHDLRGNLSIVSNVSHVLRSKGSDSPQLATSLRMLESGVSSLHALLDDLTTQARLDAGVEQREVRRFDAAAALASLCTSSQAIAAEHGLYLKAEGPPSLMVDGDRVKVCRVAQNLLLNALQYTEHGGIKITWEESPAGDRWMLSVQDTGPGLGSTASAPLSVALDAATRDMHDNERRSTQAGLGGDDPPEAPTLVSRSQAMEPSGEGLGLAIVKRLCELLDASLELQTEPGKGTTFRVTFPARYPKG